MISLKLPERTHANTHTHAHMHTHTQYRELEQSLMRQASDWVSQKQREAKTEKTLRLSQVGSLPSIFLF